MEINQIVENLKQVCSQAKSTGQKSGAYKYCEFEKTCMGSVQKSDCYNQELYYGCDSFKKFRSDTLDKLGVRERFKNVSFKQIEKRGVPAQISDQYKIIQDFRGSLAGNVQNGTGLLLQGGVGTMKTTLAVALLVDWVFKNGGTGMFISMPCLLDTIFSLKNKNPDEAYGFENKIRTTKLLVIDDLGAEYTEGWVMTKVDSIISERYERQLCNIITTNLSSEQLKKTYAERIIDRLRSTSTMIIFDGKSLR